MLMTLVCFQCVFNVSKWHYDMNGLVQERRNSSALAMELRLSCTNPSIYNIALRFFVTTGSDDGLLPDGTNH